MTILLASSEYRDDMPSLVDICMYVCMCICMYANSISMLVCMHVDCRHACMDVDVICVQI